MDDSRVERFSLMLLPLCLSLLLPTCAGSSDSYIVGSMQDPIMQPSHHISVDIETPTGKSTLRNAR